MKDLIQKRRQRFTEGINISTKENIGDRQGTTFSRTTRKVFKSALLVGFIFISFFITSAAIAAEDTICGSPDPIDCSSFFTLHKIDTGNIRDPIRTTYNEKFYAACAFHDYCYRFGYATYGKSKEACDILFLQHMEESCNWFDLKGVPTPCGDAAKAYYAAVAAAGAGAFQKGTDKCEYEGFCPPGGKFSTTGWLNGCKCKKGNKVYADALGLGWVLKETAYCTGAKCPRGRFPTTGEYNGCECPTGSKDYLDVAKAYAHCTGYDVPCPMNQIINTTGVDYACACPEGSHKEYLDLAKIYATCTRPCPAGKFATTGIYKGCDCTKGYKKYGGVSSSEAWCEGADACPPKGEFSTTDKYRGCHCVGGEKHYTGVLGSLTSEKAWCETYPDGTLVRLSKHLEVYVIQGGQKRWIPDPDTLEALGYGSTKIRDVDQTTFDSFPMGTQLPSFDGKLPDGTLVQQKGTTGVYLIQGGKKCGFPDGATFDARHYNRNQVRQISQAAINKIPTGPELPSVWSQLPDGTLVQQKGTAGVYVMQGGKKRGFPDGDTLEALGYDWNKVKQLDKNSIDNIPLGPMMPSFDGKLPDGTLVQIKGRKEISVIQNGSKCYIPDTTTFNARGYRMNQVRQISVTAYNKIPIGQPLPSAVGVPPEGTLIQLKGHPEVYVIQNWTKHWIPNEATFNARGYSWNKIKQIDQAAFNKIPMGSPLPSVQ